MAATCIPHEERSMKHLEAVLKRAIRELKAERKDWGREHDAEMIEQCDQDILNISNILEDVRAGKLKKAAKRYGKLDTLAADQIAWSALSNIEKRTLTEVFNVDFI